ncbi:MAG: DUF59 domain-containing protein [Candidatus Pacebacteria bacterium]|nr:DUF59 domain-containing protein [Candidatus Paceibacterota bacterium]
MTQKNTTKKQVAQDQLIQDQLTQDQVMQALSQVQDPELGIDLVSLGFIYQIELEPGLPKKGTIKIKMSLTTPGCPMSGLIIGQVKNKLAEFVADPAQIEVELVFDPPWTPELMSAEAKKKLGWE